MRTDGENCLIKLIENGPIYLLTKIKVQSCIFESEGVSEYTADHDAFRFLLKNLIRELNMNELNYQNLIQIDLVAFLQIVQNKI